MSPAFVAGLTVGIAIGIGGGFCLTICVFGAVQYFRERKRADARRPQSHGPELERRLRSALRTSDGVPTTRRRDVQ